MQESKDNSDKIEEESPEPLKKVEKKEEEKVVPEPVKKIKRKKKKEGPKHPHTGATYSNLFRTVQ